MFTPCPPERGRNADHLVVVYWHQGTITESCVKWYGVGTRSEYRITRFGRGFPFLTPENVGNLLVLISTGESAFKGYVLALPEDIADVQASLGVEILETWASFPGPVPPSESEDDCILRLYRAFVAPLTEFPGTTVFSETTKDAVLKCVGDFATQTEDKRLMTLLDREYALFQMVERKLCESEVLRQFKSVDEFLATALRLLNRRKSRAGRSLENHVGYLLKEAGIPFDPRPAVDGEPDILIPGRVEYQNSNWCEDRLFVLGVKTTCKDRWRQVLNEARRVKRKHILTIQQGISASQLAEMRDARVTLIVPRSLHKMYPQVEGMKLLSIQEFVSTVRAALASPA